jgi:hypothetical protein
MGHINIVCWKTAEHFNVRSGGTLSYRYVLKGKSVYNYADDGKCITLS